MQVKFQQANMKNVRFTKLDYRKRIGYFINSKDKFEAGLISELEWKHIKHNWDFLEYNLADDLYLDDSSNDEVTSIIMSIDKPKIDYDNDNLNISKLPGIFINSFEKLDILFINAISNMDNLINTNINASLLYKEINSLMDILDSINSKGYINKTNLQVYPLINECIGLLLKDYKEYEKMQDEYGKNHGSIVNIGDNFYTIRDSMIFYRWSYNLLILKLLIYCEAYLSHSVGKMVDIDLLLDFKNISKLLSSKLEPSIREKFSRKGISFINNIYTGLDTEYAPINNTTNKLLSVQMALTTSLQLKLPKKVEFNFEEFNVFTNDTYKRNSEDIDILKSALKTDYVKDLINKSIDYYRLLNNNYLYDKTIEKFILYLKEKDIRSIEKDDSMIFVFDSDKVRGFYKTIDKYTFNELVLTSNYLVKQDLDRNKEMIKGLLESIYKDLDPKIEFDRFNNLDEYKEYLEKISLVIDYSYNENSSSSISNKRSSNQSFTHEKVNITNIVNNYIIGHLTTADLSILDDFDIIKHELDIINKSYVTISKPLNIDGVNVYIRDTMLLAPGSKKSLQAIGSLYENIPKIDIDIEKYNNMELFLLNEPIKFKEYAVRDALITMIHARYMEYFNNSLGGVGVPLTLSGLSTKFIKKYWSENKYKGYQISKKFLLSDVSSSLTPKGLNVLKDIGLKNTMYIASYRGGRNESFMYGYEFSEKIWFDYDLVSAYTTGMAALGSPDYTKGEKIFDMKKLSFEEIFNSYTVLNINFEYPEHTKYPSIPVNIDENTTVYPLSGSAIITGLEYLVAYRQGCKIKVKDGYRIPFVINKDKDKMVKPFASCIKEIQRLRSIYEKGTIGNLIYKEIGNSLYGLTVRGLNDKRKFDIKTKGMKRMIGNDLSNPLIASWITSFIRSVIGELLHYSNELDGKVVSVTTDGFITDIENLENKVLELQQKEFGMKKSSSLLNEYKKLRKYLSSDEEGLEIKKSGNNILSWTTRGQLSESSGIMAATGFQKGAASLNEVQNLFIDKLKSDDKSLLFLRTSLRSALDIYKEGGHVTRTYSDQIFRLMYDNKRLIIDSDNTLLDSKPLNKADIGELLRYISNLPKSKQYSRNSNTVNLNKYNSNIELFARNFVKALLVNELGLNINSFENYKHIVSYLKKYNSDIKINENYISQLKRRGMFVKVPWSIENDKFANYVKLKFPNFDSNKFWKEGSFK
jgi:hypothetical protein